MYICMFNGVGNFDQHTYLVIVLLSFGNLKLINDLTSYCIKILLIKSAISAVAISLKMLNNP